MNKFSGKKILLVDDTPENLTLLAHALKPFGLEVLTASEGKTGLRLAKEHKPDIVLLDIMMPGIDGYEVCEVLKSDPATKNIPVIFLTAKADPENIERGFQLGCEEYITKPFQLRQVCARVRTLLAHDRNNSRYKAPDIEDIAGMKILVVDDNPDNIRLLQRTLKPLNLEFSIAPNGIIALDVAVKNPPDLILMDVMMPEMNGFIACEKIKEKKETKDIPLIFLTAKHERDDIQKGFDLGCVDYIPKPFVVREVLARVLSHLRLRKMVLEKDKWIQQLEGIKAKLETEVLKKTLAANKERDEAVRASSEKTDYIIKMTHELRTPMNAILGFSQLLDRESGDPLTPRQKENIQYIKSAGKHLVSLIDDVLELEKLESGTLKLCSEKTVLQDMVRDRVLPLVSGMAEENNIHLENDLETAQKLVIHCDPLRMTQVLVNLITNGIKYNRPEGCVRVGFRQAGEGMGRITVSDTGPGIPKEQVETIFKPFQRLDTNDPNVEGLGVGLTIALRYTQLMGAKLLVDSERGKGSVFSIEFPLSIRK